MARCLDDLGIDRLPAVVVSHLHADHVVGLAAVLGRMPVGVVLIGPSREPPDQWRRLEAEATAAGVPIEQVALGERREVGAVRWEVLGPVFVTPATGPNDSSVVMRVEVGGLSMLLTGDVELPAQLQLLGGSGDLGVDVLKVPHHGAADQDPQLLAATGAAVAIISVGTGNTYGHPAPSTLELLRGFGMAVARTDLHSDVAVVRGDDGTPTLVARNPSPS
jgi:competence protein ComEC